MYIQIWHVYLNDKLIGTVNVNRDMEQDKVTKLLISYRKYDSNIKLTKNGTFWVEDFDNLEA